MPSDINVNTDPNSATAMVTWTEPIAIDNSRQVTLTSTHNSPTTFEIGTTTVAYTATDGCDNFVTASFNVTVTGKMICSGSKETPVQS